MRTRVLIAMLLLVLAALAGTLAPARAQFGPPSWVHVPDTSIENPAEVGFKAHTNHVIHLGPAGGLGPGGGMTPAQMWSFYGMNPPGGSNVIAIVDAYHYPTALNDFNYFSGYFGLPTEPSGNPLSPANQVFQVVYATGTQPATNGGWAQEAALDIEWAHAMAPNAKIVLVEAASNSLYDLMAAVDVAGSLPGVKEVSMSWSSGEFKGETTFDAHFPRYNGIVYFACTGDRGGVVQYPAACPNVVAVGGTTVYTYASGSFASETGWSGSGGGQSKYEAKPSYQVGVPNTPAKKRGIPDISCNANPSTGVSVYDSTPYGGMSGWMVFGGTSVSSPCVAGMVNLAGNFYPDSTAELTIIYGNLGTPNLRDITSGKAGRYRCAPGWDYVTGVGSPQGTGGSELPPPPPL